jgi:hypothetical protein
MSRSQISQRMSLSSYMDNDEHDALMGSDSQQPTDPTRKGDTPAFYIALVRLSSPMLSFVPYLHHFRHQRLSVLVSPQSTRLSYFQPNIGFGSLNVDHHFVQ